MNTTICSFQPDPSDFQPSIPVWYRCPCCESVTQLNGNAILRCGECGAIKEKTIIHTYHPVITDPVNSSESEEDSSEEESDP